MYREWKKIEFPKEFYIYECGNNGRPRNRWQDVVREDGRIVGGEGWHEKVHNREEWRKLLTVANLVNVRDAFSVTVCAGCDLTHCCPTYCFSEQSCHRSKIFFSLCVQLVLVFYLVMNMWQSHDMLSSFFHKILQALC